MTGYYLPIESSDKFTRPAAKDRFGTLLKSLAFILILVIATFIAAAVFLQLLSGNVVVNSSSHETPVAFRSLAVESQQPGAFRPPIGGRLVCSRRLVIPSPTSPTDANQVRPADIKYIAAMGDSLLTGFLSYTEHAEAGDNMRNAVGNSFVTGGDGELETHLTLANIFRALNPSLAGYSTGLGLEEAETNLNVAFTAMWVDDMQRQARELIRRLSKYPPQSLKDDWKLIHIFIGTRDISGFCTGERGTDKHEYKRNLTEAITILQQALPKSIISIIGVTNLKFMFRAPNIVKQIAEVPCKVYDFDLLAQRRIEEYREAVTEIVAESQNSSRKDQVVIAQHLFDDLWEPLRKKNGSFNTDFYATDAFHFSNYGNSLVAKQLWNQLISPDYRKITNSDMMSDDSPDLLCPEFRCPFIRTPANTVACKMSDENVIA